MSFTLAPYVFWQAFDGVGDPLAGGSIEVYLAGTNTPTPTYADSTGTLNAWPITLDSEGRAVIYLDPVFTYKFIAKDSDGATIPGGTQDIVAPVGAGSAGLGLIFDFAGDPNAGITNTTYPAGATFDKLHPGTAVFAEDGANLSGTYVLQATGRMDTSGTLTVAIVDLTSGSPDTPLATLTITSLTGAVATSGAITFGAAGISRQYGIKTLVSANTGFAYGIHLMKTA